MYAFLVLRWSALAKSLKVCSRAFIVRFWPCTRNVMRERFSSAIILQTYALKFGIASIFFANSGGIDTDFTYLIKKSECIVINKSVGNFSAISARFEPKRLTALYCEPRRQPHGLSPAQRPSWVGGITFTLWATSSQRLNPVIVSADHAQKEKGFASKSQVFGLSGLWFSTRSQTSWPNVHKVRWIHAR